MTNTDWQINKSYCGDTAIEQKAPSLPPFEHVITLRRKVPVRNLWDFSANSITVLSTSLLWHNLKKYRLSRFALQKFLAYGLLCAEEIMTRYLQCSRHSPCPSQMSRSSPHQLRYQIYFILFSSTRLICGKKVSWPDRVSKNEASIKLFRNPAFLLSILPRNQGRLAWKRHLQFYKYRRPYGQIPSAP